MTQKRAYAIAIAAMTREIKRVAANANLEDVYHAGTPGAIADSRYRAQLREAIVTLTALEDD